MALDTAENLKLTYGTRSVKVRLRDGDGVREEVLPLDGDGSSAKLAKLAASPGLLTIHTEEATLGQIFIQLTGRGLRDEPHRLARRDRGRASEEGAYGVLARPGLPRAHACCVGAVPFVFHALPDSVDESITLAVYPSIDEMIGEAKGTLIEMGVTEEQLAELDGLDLAAEEEGLTVVELENEERLRGVIEGSLELWKTESGEAGNRR